ncbi:HesA/MoeB/ThiF family protein [Desulfomarina sp.]
MITSKIFLHLLRSSSIRKKRPDGSQYVSLSVENVSHLAEKTDQSLKDIELAALENDIVPERYSRNQTSLSNQGQKRLLQSHVAIIGLGGLGGTVTEILARIGTGRMTLIDGDVFDDSNLNRQLLSTVSLLGTSKALTAARKVKEINPAVETVSHDTFLTAENGRKLLQNVDLAIDCLDTVSDRFTLENICRELDIPMVSAAIGGSCGQATLILPGDPGLRLIYGTPEPAKPDSTVRPQQGDEKKKRGAEATLGTLPFAAVYMAAVECAEAVTLLLGRPPELHKKLFLADTREHTSELIDFT